MLRDDGEEKEGEGLGLGRGVGVATTRKDRKSTNERMRGGILRCL